MDTQGKQLEDHTPQWTMLTQQDIQDMLLEFKLIKMKVHLMLDKEITRLRKTKLKPSQLYQIAMDQMVQKVSTALQESLPQCAQEIRSQRRKMVSLQHAESCQHAQLIANSCHQNATEQDKWRALPNKMKVHLMLDKEITKLKKIKWKPNQLYQPVMDPMVQKVSTVWWKNRPKNQLLFNSKAITNTIIDTTTNIDKTKSQLQVNKETPKVRKIKWNLRELSQPVMEQMDQQKSTASHHQHQRQRALLRGIITHISFKLQEMMKKHSHTHHLMALTFQNCQSVQEWTVQMLVAERFNADKLEDSQLLEIGSSKPRVMMKRMLLQTTTSSPLEPHNSQSALVWTEIERDQELTADRLEDTTVHGQWQMISRSRPLVKSRIFLNFQPAINGSRQTANQSALEIWPLAAVRRELQSHQRGTDMKASGPTSQARPPSNQESSQETVLPTTTSTERKENWNQWNKENRLQFICDMSYIFKKLLWY